jgi:hypothetical protein
MLCLLLVVCAPRLIILIDSASISRNSTPTHIPTPRITPRDTPRVTPNTKHSHLHSQSHTHTHTSFMTPHSFTTNTLPTSTQNTHTYQSSRFNIPSDRTNGFLERMEGDNGWNDAIEADAKRIGKESRFVCRFCNNENR